MYNYTCKTACQDYMHIIQCFLYNGTFKLISQSNACIVLGEKTYISRLHWSADIEQTKGMVLYCRSKLSSHWIDRNTIMNREIAEDTTEPDTLHDANTKQWPRQEVTLLLEHYHINPILWDSRLDKKQIKTTLSKIIWLTINWLIDINVQHFSVDVT